MDGLAFNQLEFHIVNCAVDGGDDDGTDGGGSSCNDGVHDGAEGRRRQGVVTVRTKVHGSG